MQTFYNSLNIKKNDVISIVGAGGKTTLMFTLAKESKQMDLKVLLLTTTKIGIPRKQNYDFIDFTGNLFINKNKFTPGIYINAPLVKNKNKVDSTDISKLKNQICKFDLILIEADGAAKKSLKAWEDYEPVIPEFTTKTIGIIDISSVDKEISEINIHRIEKFLKLTNSKIGAKITINHLKKIIESEKALFKNSKGEKILFINKVETEKNLQDAKKLKGLIKIKTFITSLHKGIIYD
jgi:probable selenium-dependent hydroxylase accessory protein YqeC